MIPSHETMANFWAMRKKNLLLFFAVLATLHLCAQIKPVKGLGPNIVRCYAPPVDAGFESWLQRKTDERKTENLVVKPYVVPLVFHIVYDGEAEGDGSNLSQALIQQQVLQLNKDYANLSNSPYAVAAATGIQFVLAQKNPTGGVLAEPGIDRIDRNSKHWMSPGAKGWTRDYIADTIKPQSIWNPEKYINVWLVPAMNNGGTGKLLGFSTFPVSSTLDGLDANPAENNQNAGVVIDHSTVGSIFRPQTCDVGWGKGKTLSHELGHYFGLRHIWGDETCGNDYVDDTPVQEDANYGTPIHPKPNSCGTADEMFENYMDYSDDEVLNTFTAGQVDRMQTVMLFSPRRVNLPLSDVGFVTVTGSNRIAFAGCNGQIITSETGVTGTYPRYKDISLNLNSEYQASAAATVTIKASGTAVANTQYQVLTPTLTFAKGDAYKPVVVRLFDNASVDGDREIDINYTISGQGVTPDTTQQTINIMESDDDDIVFAGNSVINILDENFETIPAGSLVPQGWGSYISTGYPNLFVAGTNGNAGGSGKAAYITNNKSSKPNTYTKGEVGAAELLSPQINPLQYRSIDTLKFKYRVKGNADDHGYALYDIGDGSLYFWGAQGITGSGPYYGTSAIQSESLSLPVPSGVLGKKFSIAFYWETDTAKNGGDPGLNIDDVSLSAEPYSIETTASQSFGYDVQAGTTNNFRSSNNRVVTAISSASAKIANLTAQLSEAGNDKPTVVVNGDTVNRTRKVITLLPGTDNTSTSYTATFYFTSEEMAAWGSRAGGLRILKVRNGVPLSGNLSSTDAVIISPSTVNNRLSTDGYITYTATITGFGQFALVDTTSLLPVFTFASFTGAVQGTTVALDWKTVDETNEAPFEVQRSTDSVSFTKIASVTAKNTSANEYTYPDANLTKGTKYFYRIKQTDNSNNSSFTNILSFTIPLDTAATPWVTIYPNPVKDLLSLDFSNTSTQMATFVLTDMSGRVLYKASSVVDGHKEITTASLGRAMYILQVQTKDHTQSFKILKE